MGDLPNKIVDIVEAIPIERSNLINATPFVEYLWCLRKAYSFLDADGVTKYQCVFDIFSLTSEKVRQYVLFMSPISPSSYLPRMIFKATSVEAEIEGDGGEQNCLFSRLVEKIEQRRENDKEEEGGDDEDSCCLTKDEHIHCFTNECMMMLKIIIYDYFMFRDLIAKKQLDKTCDLKKFISSLRSFLFEFVDNDVLPCQYERSRKENIQQIFTDFLK